MSEHAQQPGTGVFRVELRNGERRWALGPAAGAPDRMLPADWRLDHALASGDAWAESIGVAPVAPMPRVARVLAPIENQEVWAAGVTYVRSRDARLEESGGEDLYARVYRAARPELFFKAPGWRVRGPGEAIGIRADSGWSVPEPELGIVVTGDLTVVGVILGNDVSSRSIEGENPLYLPQAKAYDASCSLGPAIVPAPHVSFPILIRLRIEREGGAVFVGETSTAQMARTFEELAGWLGRALTFPVGAILLTGTGIVPPSSVALRDGDLVSITGTGLGELRNPVSVVGRRD